MLTFANVIDLERHITVLLLSNDCVIVPGFGGFMAHHVDAFYDDGSRSYYPPTRTVGFNPQLTLNDSLMVQSYIETYDMSYPEALTAIEQQVNELVQTINNEGCYEMGGIGTIWRNEEGQYSFEPCEAGVLTPSLYGLGCFEIDKQAAQLPETMAEQPEAPEQEESKAMTMELYPEQQTEGRHGIGIIAAACAVLLVLLLFPASLGNGDKGLLQSASIDSSLLYRLMPKGVTTELRQLEQPRKEQEQETAGTDAVASRKEQPASQPEQAQEKPQEGYCIVLASKVSDRNARKFVDALQQEGMKDARILKHGDITRVVTGCFASESEARTAKNRMDEDIRFADCWVMKIKPQD